MKTILIVLFLALPLLAFGYEHAEAVTRAKGVLDAVKAEFEHVYTVAPAAKYRAAIKRLKDAQADLATAFPQTPAQDAKLTEMGRECGEHIAYLKQTLESVNDQFTDADFEMQVFLTMEKVTEFLLEPHLKAMEAEQKIADEKAADSASAAREAADAKAKDAYDERSLREYKKDMPLGSGALPTLLDCTSIKDPASCLFWSFLYIVGIGLLYAIGPIVIFSLLKNDGGRVLGIVLGIGWLWIAVPRAIEFWCVFIILPLFAIVGLIKGAVKN